MIKKLLAEIKATRKIANEEVAGDPRTRPGREMLRKEAQRRLETQLSDFSAAFKKAGFVMFVSGPGKEKFAKLAAEEAETVTVDYRRATAEIRDMVKASIGNNREFGTAQYLVLLREVRALGAALGFSSIPNVNFEDVVAVPRDEDVDVVIDRYLNKQLGSEFITAAIEQQALKQALDLSGESSVIPVVVLGVPEETAELISPRVFSGRSIAVNAAEDVATNAVLAAFKTIKKTVKTTENQQTAKE